MNFGEMKNLFLRLLQETNYNGYYDSVFAGLLINQGKDDFESKNSLYIRDDDGDVVTYTSQSTIKDTVFYNSYEKSEPIIKPMYVYLDNGSELTKLKQIDSQTAIEILDANDDLSGYYGIENNNLLIYSPTDDTSVVWRMKYISVEEDFVNDSDTPKIPYSIHKGIVYSACLIALASENERNTMIENLYRLELDKARDLVIHTNQSKDYILTEDSFESYIDNY